MQTVLVDENLTAKGRANAQSLSRTWFRGLCSSLVFLMAANYLGTLSKPPNRYILEFWGMTSHRARSEQGGTASNGGLMKRNSIAAFDPKEIF